MKKLLALLITLAFIGQSFAGVNDQLGDLVDELNYALTVDWDQKDPIFYKAAIQKFTEQVNSLNLSNEELINHSIASLKNKQHAQFAAELFKNVDKNHLSDEQVERVLLDFQEGSMDSGAQWSSTLTITTVSVAVIATVVAYKIIKTRHETAKNSISNVR